MNYKTLLSYLGRGREGVSVTDNGIVVEKSAYVKLNIGDELYKILDTAARPMYLEELFRLFKARFPDHKFTDPKQLKKPLYYHEHIIPIGHQYLYGLDSWRHIFFGSQRDLLFETLEKSRKPMHVDRLLKLVKAHFQTATVKNIKKSMWSDLKKRFVQFEEGFFDLVSHQDTMAYSEYSEIRHVYPFGFDRRIPMFKTFVETNHRFPLKTPNRLEECSLHQWLYDIKRGHMKLTSEQKEQLDTLLLSYENSGYPRTSYEHMCQQRCLEYKQYVLENQCLPSVPKAYPL